MNLVQGSIAVLNDAKFYLQKIAAVDYAQPIPLLFDSSIGVHTRHFVEFYQCLLLQAVSGHLNYCLRKRDLDMEQNPSAALDAIDKIIENLEELDLEKTIILHHSKDGGDSMHSSLGRELHSNFEHCIHHLALIKVGLKIVTPTMKLPAHFGFAPSTLQHRQLQSKK